MKDPKERLKSLSELDNNTGCWNWKGTLKNKYGGLTIGSRTDGTRRQISAHRYSYMVFKGEIPEGLYVCHRCDNTKCINPEHLWLGTHQDNVDDREAKGRNNPIFGEQHVVSKLTEAQVLEIRDKYSKGGYTHRSLAKEYNLKSHTTIGVIINLINWKQYLNPPKP